MQRGKVVGILNVGACPLSGQLTGERTAAPRLKRSTYDSRSPRWKLWASESESGQYSVTALGYLQVFKWIARLIYSFLR